MKKWPIYPTPPVCSMYAFQTRYSTFKKKKRKKRSTLWIRELTETIFNTRYANYILDNSAVFRHADLFK